MPENDSALLVPLRSNARALLTGTPIEAVRRRLKFASLVFDRVYLEAGVYPMHAGPGGHFGDFEEADYQNPPRWQTPRRRPGGIVHSRRTPGAHPRVMADTMHPMLSSPTSVSWAATLHPFTREFPPGTDWIEFARTRNPTGDTDRLARQWTREDKDNPALQRVIPEQFVRNAVIENANRDLAIATADGLAASVDPLHAHVAAQRFNDDAFKPRGFAVPLLFPQVGAIPWETIADMRRDKNITRFRAILREVEEEAAAEAAVGDIEAAAQHVQDAYKRASRRLPRNDPQLGRHRPPNPPGIRHRQRRRLLRLRHRRTPRPDSRPRPRSGHRHRYRHPRGHPRTQVTRMDRPAPPHRRTPQLTMRADLGELD
jgi:hypothetical protein